MTLEPRPAYSDRGSWVANGFSKGNLRRLGLDNQDGWPRHYMDRDRAMLEVEAWLTKRGQLPTER